MKKFALFVWTALMSLTPVQEKKLTKTGSISFEASVPSFEEIKAKNNAVTCILNTNNGEIVVWEHL